MSAPFCRHALRVLRAIVPIVSLLAVLLDVSGARAALPSAEELLESNIAASGGREAIERLGNCRMVGVFELPAMGISAELTEYREQPRRVRSIISSLALGRIEAGTDGETYWEISCMKGARVLDGEERQLAVFESTFLACLNWLELFSEVETTGIARVGDDACYRIVSTPREGHPVVTYIDTDDYLLRKTEVTLTGEMGPITIDSYARDYRSVDGVLVPFVTRSVIMGMQEVVQRYDTIEFNVRMPEGIFDIPAEVMALRDM